MTLRFNGNRIAAAAVIGVLTCGTMGACKSNQDADKTNAMLARVVKRCIPLVEKKLECERKAVNNVLAYQTCAKIKPGCHDTYKSEGGSLSKDEFAIVENAIRQGVLLGHSTETITATAVSRHAETDKTFTGRYLDRIAEKPVAVIILSVFALLVVACSTIVGYCLYKIVKAPKAC